MTDADFLRHCADKDYLTESDRKEMKNAIDRLKAENAKLKQHLDEAVELLEQAHKDITFLGDHFGCAGCDNLKPDWSDHVGDWHDCPFASDKKDECRESWRYFDRYEKLKGEVQNERD